MFTRLWLIDRKTEDAVYLVRLLSQKKKKKGMFCHILAIKCFYFNIPYKLIKAFITGPMCSIMVLL